MSDEEFLGADEVCDQKLENGEIQKVSCCQCTEFRESQKVHVLQAKVRVVINLEKFTWPGLVWLEKLRWLYSVWLDGQSISSRRADFLCERRKER